MLLGPVRGFPSSYLIWPGQSFHTIWAAGPAGKGFWAGALCDKDSKKWDGRFSGFTVGGLGLLFETIGLPFLAAGFLCSGLFGFLTLFLLFLQVVGVIPAIDD